MVVAATSLAAGPAAKASGLKTSDGLIKAAPVLLTGVLIITDGTNPATAILYDNASAATGTVLFKGTVPGAANFGGATWEVPIRPANGIYLDISGTDAAVIVYTNVD